MARSPYDNNVFINCPFDPGYRRLFVPMVFAVMDCGFEPRCLLEEADAAESRYERLFRIISECRYGLHDISATELDAKNRLPRFNMPLELGIFLGARKLGTPKQKKKRCMILDREKHRHQVFCSDIAGLDPKAHHNSPRQMIVCVRDWLSAEGPMIRMPGGARMFERYRQFRRDWPLLCEAAKLDPDPESDQVAFHDLIGVVRVWLRENEQWRSHPGGQSH